MTRLLPSWDTHSQVPGHTESLGWISLLPDFSSNIHADRHTLEEESRPAPYTRSPAPHPCWRAASSPPTCSVRATHCAGSYSAWPTAAPAVASCWDENKKIHSPKGSTTPQRHPENVSGSCCGAPCCFLTCSHDSSEHGKGKPARDLTEVPRLPPCRFLRANTDLPSPTSAGDALSLFLYLEALTPTYGSGLLAARQPSARRADLTRCLCRAGSEATQPLPGLKRDRCTPGLLLGMPVHVPRQTSTVLHWWGV